MLILPLVAAAAASLSTQGVAATSGVTAYGADYFASAQLSTALDMVERLPGFSLDMGDGVRGFAGAAGNVLIDGERTSSKSDNLHDVLNRIPASSIARLEVIRGGAPGIDMQGRTVIANVVLKTSAHTSLNLTEVARAFGDGHVQPALRIEMEHRDGLLSVTAGLVAFSVQPDEPGKGFAQTRGAPDGPVLTHADVKVAAADKGLQWRSAVQAPVLGGIGHLNFGLDYDTFRENETDNLTDLAHGGVRRTDAADQQDRNTKGELGGDYALSIGHKLAVRFVALQTLQTENYGATSRANGSRQAYNQLTRTGESIGRVQLTWKPSDALRFETGGEIAYNFLNGASSFSQDGVAIALPSANIQVDELRSEVFATGSWRVWPTLQVELGARVESSTISQSGDSSLSADFAFAKPRLAITWSPDPVDQVRFSLERVVGQLKFGDFASSANLVSGQINGGNANLQPQRDWRMDVAYERRILGTGSFSLSYRRQEIQQVLDVVPVQGVDAPGNIGDGSRDTFDVSLTAPLAVIGMAGGQFKAAGTWISSSVIDPTTHASRRISTDMPYQVKFGLTNDIPALRSSWAIDLFTGFRIPVWRIEEVRRDDYQPWLNFSWETKPRAGQSIQFEWSNITGRRRSRTVTDWAGLRGQSPIASIQTLAVDYPAFFVLRFRQAV